MLSAYMRFKYPNVIDAALAASAPIYMLTFEGSEREFFFSAVTEVIWIKPSEVYLFKRGDPQLQNGCCRWLLTITSWKLVSWV